VPDGPRILAVTEVVQDGGGAPEDLSSTHRVDLDIFRLAPTVDAATIETIAQRLEFRGTDAGYLELSQAYFDDLPLASARRILAVGCGTGLEARALARRVPSSVAIVGIDHSPELVEIAQRLTHDEGLSDRITYQVGDAHHLPWAEARFDVIVLHTLLSHVDSPGQVLREAARVLLPDGTVAVFDGDYASLTWAYPDHTRAKEIEERLLQAVVANPRVMRDLPRLVREAGLEIVGSRGVVYAEMGTGGFWKNAAELFGPVLRRSGLVPFSVVDEWLAYQEEAVEERTFFGASNYYTYLLR
jgi:SAM-dependent methyltransferase